MRDFRSQDSACTVPALPLNCQAKALRPNKNVNQIEPACLPGSGRKRGEQRLARLLSAEKWKVSAHSHSQAGGLFARHCLVGAPAQMCSLFTRQSWLEALVFTRRSWEASARLAGVHAQPRSFRLIHCSVKLLGLFGIACHTCQPKKNIKIQKRSGFCSLVQWREGTKGCAFKMYRSC